MTRALNLVILALGIAATGCSALKVSEPSSAVAPVAVRANQPEPASPVPAAPVASCESPSPENPGPDVRPVWPTVEPCPCCCDLPACDADTLSWPKPTDGPISTFFALAWQDYQHFYSPENLVCLGLGVGVAGVLANTPLDEDFHHWYQHSLGSPDLDHLAFGVKTLGNHMVMLPIYLGAAWLGTEFEDNEVCSTVGNWGCRTLCAMMVGAPAVGVLQYGLGAGRPDEGNSHWHPFQDNNSVAGHGFIGAVPFLTAAAMTENRLCRCGLVAASFAVDWSRIQTDAHYLSQTVLGWWIAYLAVESVNATERERRPVHFIPTATPNGPGVNLLIEF